MPEPIIVPPVDPEKVAIELKEGAKEVEEELRKLEEAKKISPETWLKVFNNGNQYDDPR